ncbi:pentapeptide repeat-containing protein [Winogradskyella psychrotolerans]|uniref:pentapeptide repeat-containing protein n=1 Tax=Winogradskyella psychrotolerans TaxID=1344585 RepID=UPI001C06FFAA|nr:pentapeptide repeat-containing protein [Winogradskyella psychrotolerans]MBU2930079.1 pentapeptide repeat-containing protein [Winogradskyella psychrotolerans]
MNQPLIDQQHFSFKDYTNSPLPKAEYSDCTFINCNFENSDLSNIAFLECNFTDCNFSNVNVMHTSFNDVAFQDCKILGVQFQNCNAFLLTFKFSGCTLNMSSFYQLKINYTKFSKCIMHQVDFTETEAKHCEFNDCDLQLSTFDRTNIEYTDFTSAYNFNINPNINQLKKAAFSKDTISGLLNSYNITLKD